MGRAAASIPTGQEGWEEQLLTIFAQLMSRRYGAEVYLFGSRSRGVSRPDSDYDLVAVASSFGEQPILRRALDRRKLWREAGGWGIPLDLHCLTPEEFEAETSGLGYLGGARQRGELVKIEVREAA